MAAHLRKCYSEDDLPTAPWRFPLSFIPFLVLLYRAVACDVTSAALNQNVWQKCVTFVQEKVRFNYFIAVERRTAKTTTV